MYWFHVGNQQPPLSSEDSLALKAPAFSQPMAGVSEGEMTLGQHRPANIVYRLAIWAYCTASLCNMLKIRQAGDHHEQYFPRRSAAAAEFAGR